MDIAALGITLNTSQVKAGAKDLDALTVSAARTETATDKVTRAFTMQGTATGKLLATQRAATTAAEQATRAFTMQGTATGQLLAVNRAAAQAIAHVAAESAQVASTAQTAAAATTANKTAMQGAQTQAGWLARAYDALAGAARRAMDAIRAKNASMSDTPVVPAAPKGPNPFGSTVMPTANLAAQFQDIGVTSAMGMNPLQIALQQGTQISAVFGSMGAAEAVKSLGQAFMSIISPVALATIAIVALLAAGLQMVDWAGLAKVTLYGVANAMEVLAPYAAIAAAGLALIYSPTIIAGLVTVTKLVVTLGLRALVTGAQMATAWAMANPVGAIVAGIALVLTALYLFRDDIKRIIGIDVIGVIQDSVNWIIGSFVGGFNGIKAVWSTLPAILGDVTISAANAVITHIEGMVNGAILLLNGLIGFANKIPGVSIGTMGNVSVGRVENQFAGAAGDAMKLVGQGMAAAQGQNWTGQFLGGVASMASTAADKLRGLADGIGGVDKAGEKLAKRYAEIKNGALEFIASQELERSVLGLTEQAANAQRYTMDLLNDAKRQGIAITTKVIQELTGLGGAMAAAEAATTKLRDAFEFTKGVAKGFLGDLKSNLVEGKTLWESFGGAAVNALSKIGDKLIDLGTDQIINNILRSIFAAIGGGAVGGWGGGINAGQSTGMFFAKGAAFHKGNVIPFARGGVVNQPTMFSMAGGNTGLMGEAGEEGILPLRRGRDGRLGVEASGGATPSVTINIDATGAAPGVEDSIREAVNEALDRFERFRAPGLIRHHSQTSLTEIGGRAA